MIFLWDWRNREHLAKHGVTPNEAKEVADNPKHPYPLDRPDGKHVVWGQTRGGRHLQVIYVNRKTEEIDFDMLDFVDRERIAAGEPAGVIIHARP